MENWVAVKGFEKYYEVSDLGRVRSGDRSITNNLGTFTQPGRVLKGNINKAGYEKQTLTDHNKKQHTVLVHRLVAMAFLPNPENKKNVNHKDGNKSNNELSNLEWATDSENMKHAIDTGLLKIRKGQEIYFAKFTDEQARYIKTAVNNGDLSIKDACIMFSSCRRTISDMVKGRTWKHVT
jgi:NUMOD4 motif/HNH endonuclease